MVAPYHRSATVVGVNIPRFRGGRHGQICFFNKSSHFPLVGVVRNIRALYGGGRTNAFSSKRWNRSRVRINGYPGISCSSNQKLIQLKSEPKNDIQRH